MADPTTEVDEFDDLGGVDDDDLVLALGQVERMNGPPPLMDHHECAGRAPKRRRLDAGLHPAPPTPAPSVPLTTLSTSSNAANALPPGRSSAGAPSAGAFKSRSAACTGEENVKPLTPRHPMGRVSSGSASNGTRAGSSARSRTGDDRCPADNLPEHIDLLAELDDLPSDAFDSSFPPVVQEQRMRSAVRNSASTGASTLAGNLRQTTLFGGSVASTTGAPPPPGRASERPNYRADEAATHHKLNAAELSTWEYPTNLGPVRDYQYNIVQKALFHNLLVALPTGLGKTFIAATVMLNWFRWTTSAQIVFVAPTKPLVAQQVEACLGIAGIPRSQTTMLTGAIAPGLRAQEWIDKRIFFLTPQTMINDLKTGICDPKRVVCVVVDEAHRATGSYAYVEVIQFMRRFNPSFRVLALTATPGASVESVQEVIDGLDIARIEIRTEESLDIQRYIHHREVNTVLFDPSDDMSMMKDLFAQTLRPILKQLNELNAYRLRDPMALTAYGLMQARQQWMNSDGGRRASMGVKGKMHAVFGVLAALAHSIALLNFHGIGPFYHYLVGFRNEVESGANGGKYRKQVVNCPHFHQLMTQARQWINDPDFLGHPKLAYLLQEVLNHFLTAGEGGTAVPPSATRIMIFAQYRDSADEIVRVLARHEPMIRPHVFVGQAAVKGAAGMNQKTQLDVIAKFQAGVYNTLVATCVGEEGLDIGEVDLIVCCDSSSSPIRMLQRMGRTGRKRRGKIVLLLMRGKEEDSFTKAKDGYEKMQRLIADGARFDFHDDRSPRILPRDVLPTPKLVRREIPPENSQSDGLPEPRRRSGKVPKRPAKKFHLPDGVRTGFVKASQLGRRRAVDVSGDDDDDGDDDGAGRREEEEEEEEEEAEPAEVVECPSLDAVLLTAAQESELVRRYQYVYGDDGAQTISMPRLDRWPAEQRALRPAAHVPHSRLTRRTVRMLQAMHATDDRRLQQLARSLQARDRDAALRRPSTTTTTTKPSNGARLVANVRTSPVSRPTRRHATTTATARPRPRPQSETGSSETDSVVETTDPATADDLDDMDDFVVNDDDDDDDLEEIEPAPLSSTPLLVPSSSSLSSPSRTAPAKPFFYCSPPKTSVQSSQLDDDELPDVGALQICALVPALTEDLLSSVDQPLEARRCRQTGRDYLLCDYNRDGDSYRSPWSNAFDPPLPDGTVPSEKVRKMEEKANDAFDVYRELYYEGGVSSVYFWNLDDGFAGVVLLQKGSRTDGAWDSIHVFEAIDRGRKAHYKLTSTVILHLGTRPAAAAAKAAAAAGAVEGAHEMELSGNMTRQVEQDLTVLDDGSHIVNIGKMVEDMELKMRNLLPKDVVGDLRSLPPLTEAQRDKASHRSVISSMNQ
ncbi:MAG: 3'-5' DNA helicase [Phylliscum demangeonii]|nr:MAG: 3'-5' DNA helicase [Phylliscum demangeonii]